MLDLAFRDIGKVFGSHRAIDGVSFEVSAGSLTAVVGPSGCGKSTLLDLAAGLSEADEGVVTVGGQTVDGPGPRTAIVFQDDALLPWLTVRENVALGLRLAGVKRTVRAERADRVLGIVGLRAWGDHRPHQLSGGMRQRVALARALVLEPEVLLLDEPFGALDYQTRRLMQRHLLAIRAQTDVTTLLVTHDLDEALILADEVVVLSGSPGRVIDRIAIDVVQPRDIYDQEFHQIRNVLLDHLEREAVEAEFAQLENSTVSRKEHP